MHVIRNEICLEGDKISSSEYLNSIMSHGSNVVIKQHLDSYDDDDRSGATTYDDEDNNLLVAKDSCWLKGGTNRWLPFSLQAAEEDEENREGKGEGTFSSLFFAAALLFIIMPTICLFFRVDSFIFVSTLSIYFIVASRYPTSYNNVQMISSGSSSSF